MILTQTLLVPHNNTSHPIPNPSAVKYNIDNFQFYRSEMYNVFIKNGKLL